MKSGTPHYLQKDANSKGDHTEIMQESNLMHLPQELLQNIFRYLPADKFDALLVANTMINTLVFSFRPVEMSYFDLNGKKRNAHINNDEPYTLENKANLRSGMRYIRH